MIRFVDLTPFYWACDDDNPNEPLPRICAFIDTCTGRFVESDLDQHTFDSEKDIRRLAGHKDAAGNTVDAERLLFLLPGGFFRAEGGAA